MIGKNRPVYTLQQNYFKDFSLLFLLAVELFEGDIVLDPITKDIVEGRDDGFTYDAMVSRKWPGGVVPYVYSSGFGESNLFNTV